MDIKIVYNWIGPLGPIWNTEAPSIINFAHVGDYVTARSNHYWSDAIWGRYFRNKKEGYMLYPAAEIENEDCFIYPFGLSWRIPFGHYFLDNSGLLEYGHTPGHIQYAVRNHNGFYFIDMSIEAFIEDSHLYSLHTYFKNMGYPLNKIIYLTGCMNADEIYENFCNRHGISNDPAERLHIISYPYSANEVSILINNNGPEPFEEPNYDEEKIPDKLLLLWNRRYRGHRLELLLGLEHINVIDKSYISMHEVDVERSNITFSSQARHYLNHIIGTTPDDIVNLNAKLPLVLDGQTDVGQMCADNKAETRHYYQNSLISVITETNYESPFVTLTEKSFKPIREKHPFIIVGSPGVIKSMRSLGFKTFSNFWSEEYDNINDPRQRMAEIIRIISEINTWNEEQVLNFKKSVKEILEYNYTILSNDMSNTLSEKIAQIVRGNVV